MRSLVSRTQRSLSAMAMVLLALPALADGPNSRAAATINPCAAKTINPCAAKTLNPCADKTLNPCAAKTLNPCDARTLNPCDAAKPPAGGSGPSAKGNPCNPCGGAGSVDPSRFVQPPGAKLASGRHSRLAAEGRELWNDRSLGNSGIACSTCHYQNYGQMNDSFDQPYPHRVAMPAQQAGVKQVNLAEMVNFCMIVPMRADPLDWSSRELAALVAYVESIQPGFQPGAGRSPNPCSPRGMKNPCNPCGGR